LFAVPRKEAGQAVLMALQPGNHQQPFRSCDPIAIGLKMSKTCITLDTK
jgi:hypothetical protein